MVKLKDALKSSLKFIGRKDEMATMNQAADRGEAAMLSSMALPNEGRAATSEFLKKYGLLN